MLIPPPQQNFSRSRKSSFSNQDHNIDPYNNTDYLSNEVASIMSHHHLDNIRRQNLIQLLSSTNASLRTEKQAKAIMELLKQQKYFAGISNNVRALNELSSKIDYKKVSQGQYIYQTHDLSECYYVLIKGEVALTISDSQDQDKAQVKEQKHEFSIEETISQIFLSMIASKTESSKVVVTVPTYENRIVKVVLPGQCFGEITIGDINRRATSALAQQTCHLIVIRKQFYDIVSRAHLKSTNKLKFQFLYNINLLSKVHRHTIQSLLYQMEQVQCPYNSVIYKEGEAIQFIYIIYKGQFKQFKSVHNIGKNIISSKKRHHQVLASSPLDEVKTVRQIKKNVTFKILYPAEILADTEVYHKEKYFIDTCICKSQQGCYFKIDKNKFMKKMFAQENNIEEIQRILEEKWKKKKKQIDIFVQKQQKDELFVKFLQAPIQKIRHFQTESKDQREKKQFNTEMKRLSLDECNFFKNFNRSFQKTIKVNRISIKRQSTCKSEASEELQRRRLKATTSFESVVPNNISDIVALVGMKTKYQKLRKPEQKISLYNFDIKNVPLYVKKKYDSFFKKLSK